MPGVAVAVAVATAVAGTDETFDPDVPKLEGDPKAVDEAAGVVCGCRGAK